MKSRQQLTVTVTVEVQYEPEDTSAAIERMTANQVYEALSSVTNIDRENRGITRFTLPYAVVQW